MGSMVWVPTGASSKRARVLTARRLCWVWSVLSTGAVVGWAVGWGIFRGMLLRPLAHAPQLCDLG
jgi:hypothetical protein